MFETLPQTSFLIHLQAIAHAHRELDTQDTGLAQVIEICERRIPLLKPIAYDGPDYDLSSGFSGDGIPYVCGPKAAIKRIQQLSNDSANLHLTYLPHYLRTRDATVSYVLECYASDMWIRQLDTHDTLESAEAFARIAPHETRIVRVTTSKHEEIAQ